MSCDIPDRYVYGLFDDSTGELVYVGSTDNPKKRLGQHKYTLAKSFRDTCRMEIFERCVWPVSGIEREFYWLQYFKSLGCNLLNKQQGRPPKVK